MFEPLTPVVTEDAESISPPVIWVAEDAQQDAAPKELDPFDVINFLLKKVDGLQSRIAEHEGFADLQNQEIEQIKAQLVAKTEELDTLQADYDVALQNNLATEQELEGSRCHIAVLENELNGLRARQQERPRIQLPFHTEQKLAKLGYSQDELPIAEAV